MTKRSNNNLKEPKASIHEGLSLEAAPDHKCLFHPSGDSFEADPIYWEYFHDALVYAEKAQYYDEYIEAAKKTGKTALEAAVYDFFCPPSILNVNLKEYRGQKGDRLYIRVFDQVGVTDVAVLILESRGEFLEMGKASRVSDDLWQYEIKKNCRSEFVKIIIDVWDFPGHNIEERYQKSIDGKNSG
ncbi:hypothetical protein IJT93_10790 [bacterium]|nr:hypothetical protein [bacterium]